MSEILAFIKTHRRDIIITAAALAASLVVMLCRRDFCRVGFTPQVVHRAVPAARVPDFDRRGFRL